MTVEEFMALVNQAVKNADYSEPACKPRVDDVEGLIMAFDEVTPHSEAKKALASAMRNELLKDDTSVGVPRAKVLAEIQSAVHNPTSWRRGAMGDNAHPRRMRSTRRHIEEWRDTVPVGTEATVAEICNFASAEYRTPFKQEYPSPGAVAARLFPTSPHSSLIPGIEQLPGEGGPMRVRTLEVPDVGTKVSTPYTSHNTYGLMVQVRGVMEQLKEQLGPHWPQAKSLIRNFLNEDDPAPEHDSDNLPF